MDNRGGLVSSDRKTASSTISHIHGSGVKDLSSQLNNSYGYNLKRKDSDRSDEQSELNHGTQSVHMRSSHFDLATPKDVQHDFMQVPHDIQFTAQLGVPANAPIEVAPIQCAPGPTQRKEKKGVASSSKGETPLSSISHDHVSTKDGSSSDQRTSVPASKRKSNDGSNKRVKSVRVKPELGCLEITKSGQSGVTTKRSTYTRAYISSRRPVTDEEKTRAKNAALSFQSVFPFFVVVMKATFVSRGFYMHVPLRFVKAHLPQQDAKFTLRNAEGKEWQVSYLYKEGRSGFLGGWADFVFANNLEEGDACVFELVKGDKELVMNVSIFRVVEEISPLTKRHFVLPVKEGPRSPFSKEGGPPAPDARTE